MSDIAKLAAVGIGCLALGIFGGNYLQPSADEATSGAAIDEERVQAIVSDYISNNPEKIVESLQSMQAKAMEEQRAQMQNAVKNNLPALKAVGNSPVVGDVNSKITLVEFFDYNCGHCKRMAETVQTVLKAHPDVKVVFKEFPILSEASQLAAQAALAVHFLKPEKYLEYHMMLMKHRGQYTLEALKDYAGQIQLDLDAFEKEAKSVRVAKELQAVQDIATKSGIQGTPALVIGDELIPGAAPFADIDQRIKALKGKS